MQGKKAMLLWMFDDVHLLRLNAHKSFLGTAWLSRKRLRGARCTLRSWQKCLKSFRSNFHLYLHRKKNPIPIASTILLQNLLSKKELDFFQSNSTNKTKQFPTKKNTQIFGTLFCWTSLIRRSRQWVSATLELMLSVPWQLRSNPKGVGKRHEGYCYFRRKNGGFCFNKVLKKQKNMRRMKLQEIFPSPVCFLGMKDFYLSVAW